MHVSHRHPFYTVNELHAPVKVLPTLVSYTHSRAFRDGKYGLVWDENNECVDLTIEEREQALGYEAGSTDVPGLSWDDRHNITGNCFDANAMQTLWAVAMALAEHLEDVMTGSRRVSATPSAFTTLLSPRSAPPKTPPQPTQWSARNQQRDDLLWGVAAVATVQDSGERTDPWEDANLLACLQGDPALSSVDSAERLRATKRAARYQWSNNKLYRLMIDGSKKETPPLAARQAIVQKVHETHGHFGRKRTTQLLLLSYWWPGLYGDVRDVLKHCTACDKVRANFKSMQPVLHPLEVKGLMYRWGLDLFGPYPASTRGNKYVLVCIEHFSKWIEVFPLQNKTADEIAYYLLHGVIARFGAPAEILTDGGGEFEGAVSKLLLLHLIDRRTTSSNHPQANGLAERVIGTLKRGLQKSVDAHGDAENWDLRLPYIVQGYRVSPQAATKHSPYELLFAVKPAIPSATRENFSEALDFDDPAAASSSILSRAASRLGSHRCRRRSQPAHRAAP